MKISVCMATYNGEKYIKQQLESISSQLNLDDEVIISDDSSADNTLSIIKSFNDSRIKVFPNQIYKNPALNFENAISKATGDFIFLADQDDIWHENKVKIMMTYLQDYDLVVSDCKIIDESEVIIFPSFFDLRKSGKGIFKNLYRNSYLGCCMAFKKSITKKFLPFPSKLFDNHDWWIGINVDLYGKVFFINEALMSYRRHGNNVSPTSQGGYVWHKKIINRYTLVIELLKNYLSKIVN